MSGSAHVIIRIKKNADGSAALSCTRADGSVTWQRQVGAQGQFFPRHDLTHYAVETVLGHRRGFFGLVADGWDITDFGAPWPRGRIPHDADPSELFVGFLDMERASGARWTAAEFNDKAAHYYRDHFASVAPPTVSDDQLSRIRQRRAELFAQWDQVAPGQALELTFIPGDSTGVTAAEGPGTRERRPRRTSRPR